jgi:surface protein
MSFPSPITALKLRVSAGADTYEQAIPSASINGNSFRIMPNTVVFNAFNSHPVGTSFTSSVVASYGSDELGNGLSIVSTPSVLPNFVARQITPTLSLANLSNKLPTDSPFSLSVTTNSANVLSYLSSNTLVAEVNSSGLVTVKGVEGTTTITVSLAASLDGLYAAASVSKQLVVALPSPITLAANGVTIQYTGTAQAVINAFNSSPPSPLFIQADPRNTGTLEWFAVVNDSSNSQITAYAKSTGSAVSAYFTKSGQSSPVPFNNIVTTLMTDMTQLLYEAYTFNKNVSDWDTSNVTNMTMMFQDAGAFEQDISKWNVAKVTFMIQMFYGASKFNSDISGWNTSNVTNMGFMFQDATLFNRNLNGWNVAKVTSEYRINFASPALSANVALQPIWLVLEYKWNDDYSGKTTIKYIGETSLSFGNVSLSSEPLFVYENPRGTGSEWFAVVTNSSKSKIIAYAAGESAGSAYFTKSGQLVPFNNIVTTHMKSMSSMFNSSTFNENISSWDTSNATTMSGMFQNASNFTQDISRWNTALVTTMSGMFYGASKFNSNISIWNTSRVTNMSYMFNGASLFFQDLRGWNVAKVTQRVEFATGSPLAVPENTGKLPQFLV